jgi:hypothetical protein
MNIKDDSFASDTTRVTSNNPNVNNYNNIVSRDVDNIEEYEPTDPDNFEDKITEIGSWTHDDLAHNTVLGVQTFMTYWDLHSYHWSTVSTGTDTWEWECPTCKYLEVSQGDNVWPADVTCVTCLLNQGNKNTYAALIKVMKIDTLTSQIICHPCKLLSLPA